MAHYDICTVGAGMVGSAVAKYCTYLKNSSNIILVGPEEPKEHDYCKTDIFGAYYDEGRITRHLASEHLWSHLASESIKMYHSIELESNMKFYTENGYLSLFRNGDDKLQMTLDVARFGNVNFELLPDTASIKKFFPYFHPPFNSVGLYEKSNAGFINPRVLVRAQQCLAVKRGLKLIRDIVTQIEHGNSSGFKIHTKTSDSFTADKVILCVGAFLRHYDLIPQKVDLNVMAKLIVTSRILVEESLLYKFVGMPSMAMVIKTTDPSDILGEAFYVMAPVQYPNGKWYIKVGLHGDSRKGGYGNASEVTQWYRSGAAVAEESGIKLKIKKLAEAFMPDLKVDPSDMVLDTCCITETPDNKPIIDEIQKNFYIFTGCNGYAAKSSDEIGRLLAYLAINNEWDCPLPRENFKASSVTSHL